MSSFEKFRGNLLSMDIINMVHLGARAFEEIGGEVVQTTSFVIRKNSIPDYKGTYCRMIEPTNQQGKEDMFLDGENRYNIKQNEYKNLPGQIVAYWLSEKMLSIFKQPKMSEYAQPCKGLDTGDNNRFLRNWFEVELSKIGRGNIWIPYNKGGGYRKWYGLNDYVILWKDNGYELKYKSKANIRNEALYYKQGLTWSDLSTNLFGARYCSGGFIFDASGPMLFSEKNLFDIMAYMNSVPYQKILDIVCPGLHYNNGAIAKTPFFIKEFPSQVSILSQNSVDISKCDWDCFEISWDFQYHPLLRKVPTIAEAFDQWQTEGDDRFNQLKANEEELNRIFIDIYGLQDELTPEVEDKDVTVRKADLGRDIRSFISYAVGCMFGRYSLDVDGLAYAGGEWDKAYRHDPMVVDPEKNDGNKAVLAGDYVIDSKGQYHLCSFIPDKDNIIPICDDEYFEDDIVGLFVKFVKIVYGEETLDENLQFIADALGGKGQPKEVIRNYFLNDFYKDHCKIYQKCPIYWLFDSGKKNGFKALIYMHRYQPDTIARIRTDYVHEQQARYRTAIADLEQRIANASTGERVKLNKKLTTLHAQDTEIRVYEEKIHHLADQMISIDLDDGVKKNYAIFQDVLAKIK